MISVDIGNADAAMYIVVVSVLFLHLQHFTAIVGNAKLAGNDENRLSVEQGDHHHPSVGSCRRCRCSRYTHIMPSKNPLAQQWKNETEFQRKREEAHVNFC